MSSSKKPSTVDDNNNDHQSTTTAGSSSKESPVRRNLLRRRRKQGEEQATNLSKHSSQDDNNSTKKTIYWKDLIGKPVQAISRQAKAKRGPANCSSDSRMMQEISALTGGTSMMEDDDDDMNHMLSARQHPLGEDYPTSTSNSSDDNKTFVIGPSLDFWTADATLFMVACTALAVVGTITHFATIQETHSLPLSVAFAYMLAAFSVGQVFSNEGWKTTRSLFSSATPIPTTTGRRPSVIEIQQRQSALLRTQAENQHSLLLTLTRRVGMARVKFQKVVSTPVASAWTNLRANAPHRPQLQLWERTVDPTLDFVRKNTPLMERMLRNPAYKRMLKRELLQSVMAPGEVLPTNVDDARLGTFDLTNDSPTTLDEFVIVPTLKVRGMDIFLTPPDGEPESDMPTHPWLIRQGIRDVPTLVINVITPWGNILVYMEFPSWLTSWDTIVENEDDEEDVKALKSLLWIPPKRFLNADDQYRKARMKMIPSVFDGPLAVRVLAPPKKEFLIAGDRLPVTWRTYDAKVLANGKRLCPAAEIEFDCVSNRAIRAMAGILKRHLSSVSLDVALIIQKPDGQEEEEPQACVGMFRFNYIDVSQCCSLPDRFDMEAEKVGGDADLLRASQLVRLSKAELSEITEELQALEVEA